MHFLAVPAGPPGERDRQLARQGLLVEAALTGDDEVARGEQLVCSEQGEEVVRPGAHPPAQQHPRVAEPAGGSGAWGFGMQCGVRDARRRQPVHETGEGIVQFPHFCLVPVSYTHL